MSRLGRQNIIDKVKLKKIDYTAWEENLKPVKCFKKRFRNPF